MGRRVLFIRIAAVTLLVSIVVSVVAHEIQQSARLKAPNVSTRSADDRRATLAAFKAAWESRPTEATPDNARDEKDFINHTAFFVQKTYRREIGLEAGAFYRRTVSEFFTRYGSEDILDD